MNLKNHIIRLTNICLATLLTIFGFSNCEDPREEYGVPHADYNLKGKVIDKSDSKPLKGIRIGFKPYYPEAVLMYGVPPTAYRTYDADTTDVEGNYNLTDHFSIEEIQGDTVTVYVQDIDGAENGLYQDTIMKVDFSGAKKSGKRTDWYDGILTVEKDIELKQKTDE